MNNILYLYELTLNNYIDKDNLLEEYPLFETLLINYLSKNKTIINSKDLSHKFIIYLHYELDCLFYRIPRKDITSEVSSFDKTRLRYEVKKFANKIKNAYLEISKII